MLKSINRLGLVLAAALTVLSLSACSSSPYYKVDKFASMDGARIVKELEEKQGLEYQEGAIKHVDYLWTGVPKESVEPNDGVVVHFEGGENSRGLSRDDLEANAQIDKVTLFWSGEALGNWSDAPARADTIMKNCGLGDVLREGQDSFFSGWYRIGKCKLQGRDAFWGIGLQKNGNVYVTAKVLGESSYEELATNGIHVPTLM